MTVPRQGQTRSVRLVIDTDPGNGYPGSDVDDVLAIALALRSPEVELLALTVVAGNVPVERGVRGALEVLQAAGAGHVPVHRGAPRPLVQDPRPWRALLDTRRDDVGAQRLWEGFEPYPTSLVEHPTPAAQALVELVDASPGEVTVLAIGPLTNVATAMLLDPEWAAKVARVVWMGGAFELPDVLQELNAAYDPEATSLVLNSVAPLLVVPLDVTLRTWMRSDDVDRLEAAGTPLTDYLARTVRPWVTWLAERFGRDGCPLHDPLALAALLDPSVVTTRSRAADIELAGRLTRGRTVAWDATNDELLQVVVPLPDARPVDIAYEVDNARFLPLLLDRLTS
ncbi:MAG: nucleoside hydrolase [Frankiales bacterium]|nr:nucleoside hydrolase [Frankiales bacterium]